MANSCIWRAVGSSYTESAATTANKILFNEEPIVLQNVLVQSEFDVRIAISENERPKQNLNDLGDEGVDGIDVVVTGRFGNADSEANIGYLMTWLKEAKTQAITSPFGRFGLRLDDFPWFNSVPSATSGYLIANVKFIREGEYKNRAAFILTLRLNGNLTAALP